MFERKFEKDNVCYHPFLSERLVHEKFINRASNQGNHSAIKFPRLEKSRRRSQVVSRRHFKCRSCPRIASCLPAIRTYIEHRPRPASFVQVAFYSATKVKKSPTFTSNDRSPSFLHRRAKNARNARAYAPCWRPTRLEEATGC